jgi:hypothetical protein
MSTAGVRQIPLACAHGNLKTGTSQKCGRPYAMCPIDDRQENDPDGKKKADRNKCPWRFYWTDESLDAQDAERKAKFAEAKRARPAFVPTVQTPAIAQATAELTRIETKIDSIGAMLEKLVLAFPGVLAAPAPVPTHGKLGPGWVSAGATPDSPVATHSNVTA